MKIDILIPVAEKGGVENVINMIAPYLQKQNIEVRVIQLIWEETKWVMDDVAFFALLNGKDGHTLIELIEAYANFLIVHTCPDVILATCWPAASYIAKRVIGVLNCPNIKIISWLHAPVSRYYMAGYGGYDHL